MDNYKKQCEYVIGEKIGRGGFSEVYCAVHKVTGVPVAIKAIAKEKVPKEIFERELKLQKMIDNPFCCTYFETFEDHSFWYIVMEKLECGTLLSEINKHGGISESRSRHVFCQLISTLDYLHEELHIAHRDVKAENIMFDRNENIRLIDFGLSNQFKRKDSFLKTACGSPAYAPPEMLRGKPYDEKADVWSAGVVLYAMTCGMLPFHDSNIQKLVQKIVYTEPEYPDQMPPETKKLIEKLLNKNPEERLSLKEIIEEPWFCKYIRSQEMNSSYGVEQGWRSYVNGKFQVDQRIIEEMQRRNIPTDTVVSDLENDVASLQATSYKILKRETVTEEMEPYVEQQESKLLAKRVIGSIPRPSMFPKRHLTILSPYARVTRTHKLARRRAASNGEVIINEIGVPTLRAEYLSKLNRGPQNGDGLPNLLEKPQRNQDI